MENSNITAPIAAKSPQDYYSNLSERQKEIAPQIERLLDGISVADAIKLLHRIRMAISDKGVIKST